MRTHATPQDAIVAARRRRALETRERDVDERLELARRNAATNEVDVLEDERAAVPS